MALTTTHMSCLQKCRLSTVLTHTFIISVSAVCYSCGPLRFVARRLDHMECYYRDFTEEMASFVEGKVDSLAFTSTQAPARWCDCDRRRYASLCDDIADGIMRYRRLGWQGVCHVVVSCVLFYLSVYVYSQMVVLFSFMFLACVWRFCPDDFVKFMCVWLMLPVMTFARDQTNMNIA
eukprot:GDKI01012438.1.p1 GENE.GDKI01012438.1~~GDKI01012438.1.p1  ORF type:complete len:177 (-),score=6.70 GDKI01012438.1:43-573(-)